ncbi:glycoside hydrolase family 2 protein [Paenibacillus spongiae]|uniref:beta-mannosidase n=1 Tax=Paenibacillus spongiae TaxID=2909671 RepID=A0ABY5S8Z2_9BACL|nr:glycoside hydrolase family 2 TIM barrel-domain containing protein [Paenibacillus spongiae]UVI28768.1 hypothetical protein L1F29_25500 [Paenibacillus spongiae]
MAIRAQELTDWEVRGFYPHVPHLGQSMETGVVMGGVTDWMTATVPGGVHYDLWAAGWIENPYYGMNSLNCEWVENRWWMYKTAFSFQPEAGEKVYLNLKGVDYKAHFYLNKEKLGFHEGMFAAVRFDITGKLKPEGNELIVLLEHAPDEMGQIGYTSRTWTQKSRFTYKWDFSTRMVPIGLWDGVSVETTGMASLDEVRLEPLLEEENGRLIASGRMTIDGDAAAGGDPVVVVSLFDDEVLVDESELVCKREGTNSLNWKLQLNVPAVRSWNPNGMGEAGLYGVRIRIEFGGKASDTWQGFTGFRTLEWIANDDAPDSALPYTVRLNGRRMYIKGVNLTPLDIQYGTVTRDRYERMVRLLKEAGVNLVRVWGGGIIEKEDFYDCCDRAGILVWQEFIQSSSGIDNVPSKDPHFLELLKETAEAALRVKRNHVSLACWSGGNELMDIEGMPSTFEDDNIEMLRRLVMEHDPGRYFLPTSASGPNEFLMIDQPGRNHDVHGPWKYGGPVEHYNQYNRSDSLLHSEFGVDGCCSTESMACFLPESERKVDTMENNPVWRHHGEWWDTLERDTALFGAPDDLEQFAMMSQWTQAEGIRYALEANRRRKFRNSGSIVWQFNEPFPNVSCTSLVDYYERPKMAYYWARKAYATKHISLRYDKLAYSAGEHFMAEVFLHNSGEAEAGSWSAQLFDETGRMHWEMNENVLMPDNGCLRITDIRWPVLDDSLEWFAVRLQLGQQDPNVYVFSLHGQHPFAWLRRLPPAQLEWSCRSTRTERGVDTHTFEVLNSGSSVAWYVSPASSHPAAPSGRPDWFCRNAHEVLMPSERRIFEISAAAGSGIEPSSFSFMSWNNNKQSGGR